MQKTFTLLLALLAVVLVHAQRQKPTAVVTFDYVTGLPDKYVPFDEYFTAVIPIDSMFGPKDVKAIHVYKIKYKAADGKWYLKLNAGETPGIYKIPVVPGNFQAGGKGFHNLVVTVPPIPPKTPFCFVIQYNNPADIVNSLLEVNHDIYLNGGVKAVTLFADIQRKVNGMNAVFRDRVVTPKEFTLNEYQTQLTANGYAAHYANISTAITSCGSYVPHYQALLADITASTICNNVYKCNCADDLAVSEYGNGVDSLLDQLCMWTQRTANAYAINDLATGVYSFYDGEKVVTTAPAANTPLTAGNFKQILANLTGNLKALDKLRTYLLYNSYGSTVANRNALLKDIHQLRSDIATQLKAINDELDFFKQNLHTLAMTTDNDAPVFGIYSVVAAEHVSADVKTAFGNHLIPDIGVLTMVAFSDNKPRLVVRPYWGLNISLRPVNKDRFLKEANYKKAIGINSIWQQFLLRTSISVGFTALPLDKELKKGEDLFKGMSLINGINFRINRMMRCGTGYVLYRQDNPNPTLKRSVTASPYISLSVDLDVAAWISHLTGKIF